MRFTSIVLTIAIASLLEIFTVQVPTAIGQLTHVDSDAVQVGGIAIYDADGVRAENCHVASVNRNSRFVLHNTSNDGPFIPGQIDRNSIVDRNLSGTSRVMKNKSGILPNVANQLAHLVVSEDGKQATFIPFNYSGNAQLRHCGKLRLDTSSLDAKEKYTVVVVWRNCLAGRYAKRGNQLPDDPKDSGLDWRFRKFITVVSRRRLESDFDNYREFYLPAGEVSVAVISDRQAETIGEFVKENLSQAFKYDVTLIPATSGIHRIVPLETSTVQLETGTCLKGKLVADKEGLPNWNDLGFVDAYVSISDQWRSRFDWIPGYDAKKGVNHYYKTLQSAAGLQARTRTLAETMAILKTDGRFMTYPLPNGNYQAHLYRPGQTTKTPVVSIGENSSRPGYISSGEPEARLQEMSVGVPLISQSGDNEAKFPKAMPNLVRVRIAAEYGDLSDAEKHLKLARANDDSSEFVKSSLLEAEKLIEKRKRLNEMYKEKDRDYNRQATRFLLDIALSLIEHNDLARSELTIQSARRFYIPGLEESMTPDSVMKTLVARRANVLSGERRSPLAHPYVLKVADSGLAFKDLGLFNFRKPNSTREFDKPNFNPLQCLRIPEQIKSNADSRSGSAIGALERSHGSNSKEIQKLARIEDKQSTQYTEAIESLKTILLKQLNEKIGYREIELKELRNKLEEAENRLRERKANRIKIVERHVAKELKKYEDSLKERLGSFEEQKE